MSKKFFTRNILKFIVPLFVVTTFAFVNQRKAVETSAWSGPQTSSAGNYYNSVSSESGEALRSKLKTIIGSPKPNTNYGWERFKAADEAEGKSDSVLLIYSRVVNPKNNTGGNATNWNREHTYPQSKIGSPATEDNHHIFADDNKTNGARGNKLFGVVAESSGNRVKDMYGKDTDNYTAGNYFMPNPAARGEVARATMYLNTLYNYSVTGNFQSVDLMLRWHLENPVTNRDIYRNNTVHSLQKNRNPFVDHPEYACSIWGDTNATTKSLCASVPTVAVSSVSVTPTSGTVQVNGTLTLTSSVLPANATNKSVTWSSSNNSVATVSNGVVTGKAAGSATITATSVADSSKKASATVAVAAADGRITGISLNKTILTLNIGKSEKLIAEISPSTAANKAVVWQSSKSEVATVTADGLVEAKALGEAIITVTSVADSSKKASAKITVTAPESDITGISLNKETLMMNVGHSEKLRVGVYPSTAVDKSVIWESSKSKVATVTTDGLVEAKAVGKATITVSAVSDPNKKASAVITVTAKDIAVTGVSVNKKELIMNVGNSETLNAAVLPSYATKKTLNWESGQETVAIVNQQGLVSAVALGSTKITVVTTDGEFKEYVYVTVRSAATTGVTPYQKALNWATSFLDSTNKGCDTNDRELLSSAWNSSQSAYNSLEAEAQEIVKETPMGYSEGVSVGHAKARYRIVLNQYKFNDFIENQVASNQELANETYPYYIVFIVFGLMLAFVISGIIIYKSKKVKIA